MMSESFPPCPVCHGGCWEAPMSESCLALDCLASAPHGHNGRHGGKEVGDFFAGGEIQFQIEVRPRSTVNWKFIAYYHVEARTERDALVEAARQFRERNPDKAVADCEFRSVPKG